MDKQISKRYAQRGVSASKEDVHNAIKNIDKGLFPHAFCKIVPDYLTNDDSYCLIRKIYVKGETPIFVSNHLSSSQYRDKLL